MFIQEHNTILYDRCYFNVWTVSSSTKSILWPMGYGEILYYYCHTMYQEVKYSECLRLWQNDIVLIKFIL